MSDTLSSWLQAVRGRLAQATPGPWTAVVNEPVERGGTRTFICSPTKQFVLVGETPDILLASHAPADLTYAVSVIEAAQRVIEAAQQIVPNVPSGVLRTAPSPLGGGLARGYADLIDALTTWHRVVGER